MKKRLLLLPSCFIVLSLSACSSDDPIESYKKARVGSIIEFGTYEKNDQESDGAEPIKWQVLEKEDSRLLIISKDILSYRPYNAIEETVTWENCTLRLWLNGIFFDTAFSMEEQDLISSNHTKMDANPYYSTDPGNDTTDKIFILSASEAERYFDSDAKRTAEATKSAEKFLLASGEQKWWLRTLGSSAADTAGQFSDGSLWIKNCAVFVDEDGKINYEDIFNSSGDVVSEFGVRPALWIDLDTEASPIQKDIDRDVSSLKSVASTLSLGDHFELGEYVQNDWHNGPEPIEWVVLENHGDKVLAVSKYALDCQPYNDAESGTHWNNCALRDWLHTDFYSKAFSASEQALLAREDETQGSVFLLTRDEVELYPDMMLCDATLYAIAAGAEIEGLDTSSYEAYLEGASHNCSWWLESSGEYNGADAVSSYGTTTAFNVDCPWIAVRPAIWLKTGQ